MPPSRTPNQIAEQWEQLGRNEEIKMSNTTGHLEEIVYELDAIRKEISSLTQCLSDVDSRLIELRDTNNSLADIAKSLQAISTSRYTRQS
jgi:hypothetical protein